MVTKSHERTNLHDRALSPSGRHLLSTHDIRVERNIELITYVIRRMSQGLNLQRVCRELGFTDEILVRNRIARFMKKIDAHNRFELMHVMLSMGFLTVEELGQRPPIPCEFASKPCRRPLYITPRS